MRPVADGEYVVRLDSDVECIVILDSDLNYCDTSC